VILAVGVSPHVCGEIVNFSEGKAFKAELDTIFDLQLIHPEAQIGKPPTETMLDRQAAAIRKVAAAPGKYTPLTLLAMARSLGDEKEKVFWELAALLRMHSDSLHCQDERAEVKVVEFRADSETRGALRPESTWMSQMTAVVNWDRATPHDYGRNWVYLSRKETDRIYEGEKISKSLPNCASVDEWNVAVERLRELYLEYGETGKWPPPHVLEVVGYNWSQDAHPIIIGFFDDNASTARVLIDAGERRAGTIRTLVLPNSWKPDDGLKIEWFGVREKMKVSGAARRVPIFSPASVGRGSEEHPTRLAVHVCSDSEIRAVVESEPQEMAVSPCSVPR